MVVAKNPLPSLRELLRISIVVASAASFWLMLNHLARYLLLEVGALPLNNAHFPRFSVVRPSPVKSNTNECCTVNHVL